MIVLPFQFAVDGHLDCFQPVVVNGKGFFFFLTVPHGLWDLSSPPGIESGPQQ